MQERRSSKQISILLLEDVYGTGRKGEVVKVAPGFARNCLVPQEKGIVAERNVLKRQAKLQAEREKQAVIDRQEAEKLAALVEKVTPEVMVKTDPEGNMYGSVTAQDIVDKLAEEGVLIERQYLRLPAPIKKVGEQRIHLVLKEEVACSFLLKVKAEETHEIKLEAVDEVAGQEEAKND